MLTEPLAELLQFLVIVSTATLSYDDIDPSGFVDGIAQQLENKKHPWHNGHIYFPNIVHLFVPATTSPKKIEQIEAIFNSYDFFRHIYRFIADKGGRFFDTLRTAVDVLPGVNSSPNIRMQNRWKVRLEWPNTKQCSSGLDVIVEANAEKILKVSRPKPEIPFFALLQPINVRAYRDYYLIVKRETRFGRARNNIGRKGEIVSVNDFPFARTAGPVNKSISRTHAIIEFSNNGFYLKDSNSRAGTFLRRFYNEWTEFPISKESQGVQLENGDIIRLGEALLSFEEVQPEQVDKILDRLLNGTSTGNSEEPARDDTIARCIKKLDLNY